MNVLLYALSGCLAVASAVQTLLAASKVRLYKDTLNPDPGTPLADFVTAEANFTGYPPGGTTLTAMLDPILDPVGGYSIGSPVTQFAVGTPVVTGNNIGGWFLVDSGGDLICFGKFGSAQPMEVYGQGLPVDFRLRFPTGS